MFLFSNYNKSQTLKQIKQCFNLLNSKKFFYKIKVLGLRWLARPNKSKKKKRKRELKASCPDIVEERESEGLQPEKAPHPGKPM